LGGTDGGVLRENGDALLALQVVAVHHAVVEVLMGRESTRLLQHGVDEGRLAVVDVGDDGDVTNVVARGHTAALLPVGGGGAPSSAHLPAGESSHGLTPWYGARTVSAAGSLGRAPRAVKPHTTGCVMVP